MSTSSNRASLRCAATFNAQRATPSTMRPGRVLPVMMAMRSMSLPREVFEHEPRLQLVGPDDFADDDVIGAVVATLRRGARQRSRFGQQEFMRLHQPLQLRLWRF